MKVRPPDLYKEKEMNAALFTLAFIVFFVTIFIITITLIELFYNRWFNIMRRLILCVLLNRHTDEEVGLHSMFHCHRCGRLSRIT